MQTDRLATSALLIPADLSKDAVNDFENRLQELLRNNPRLITLDVSLLKYVSSSHIKLLWQTYLTCLESGVSVKLQSLSPGLERVLKVLDLYEILVGEYELFHPQVKRAIRFESAENQPPYADEFRADLAGRDKALEEFLKYLQRFALPEIVLFELRTVFYEVATNIITHASMEKNNLIVFSAFIDSSKITMVFVDSGIPFNPEHLAIDFDPRSASKNHQSRGFGVILVRRIMDKVSYIRFNDNINVLTLEKTWG